MRKEIKTMNTKLLIIFIIMNILNVIIQTVKSIATIKCGKGTAAIVNAVAYGLYTYIVILMVCELPLLLKCVIVGGANLIGVWLVKFFEEKGRKDKMWKLELAIPKAKAVAVNTMLNEKEIPHNYTVVGKWVMFNCYCATQEDTHNAKMICKKYNGKMSAYESKYLGTD